MDYIETPKPTIKKPKPTTKKEKIDMEKQTFIKAKAEHKDKIAKIKANRRPPKRDRVRNTLLIKPAKKTYKLSKMKEK